MKISKNFTRDEASCNCGCDQDNADIQLVKWLEKIRKQYGKPVIIHCWNRCLKHNRTIKGSKDTSQHVKGKAVDFHIEGEDPLDIACWINDNLCPKSGGVGMYDTFVHMDRRAKKARWDMRSNHG